MVSIRELSQEQLASVVEEMGQPGYRAKQLHEWLHTHNASTYDEMTNLPKAFRAKLAEKYPLGSFTLIEKQVSKDGTRKYVFQLDDGSIIESVGIISKPSEDDEYGFSDEYEDQVPTRDSSSRLTVCFSTQVGCPLACSFCATGKHGFKRNLTADEIVSQISEVGKDFGLRVSNVVAMGQGEPFLNYDALLDALRRINQDKGLNIGARHITVSTSGYADQIRDFANEPEQFRLAISLHSANQETRNRLMPRLSGQPIRKLSQALDYYQNLKGRRITLEYMLIDGVNDSEEELQALINFCKGMNVHVNLLPYNSVPEIDFRKSDKRTFNRWTEALNENGIPVSVRVSKGFDIAGACGQLAASSKNKE